MPEPVGQIEEQLRQAVLGHRYAELPRFAELYREAVEAYVRSLAPDDPRIREIVARAGEVLQGAVFQVHFERDILAGQLAQVPKLKSFLGAPSQAPSGVRLDG
jgi:hypothetical protein